MSCPLPRPSFPEQAVCKTLFLSFSLFLLALVIASDALAHRVNVFAWVDGSTLRVECGFGGGSKVKNGLVEVRDAESGKVCATTRTSGDGTASVAITQAMLDAEDGLVVLLDAGEGHRNTWPVSREELAVGSTNRPASARGFEPSRTDDAAKAAGEPAKEAGKTSVTDSAKDFPGEGSHASGRGALPPAGKDGNRDQHTAQNAGRDSGQDPGQHAGLLLRMSEEELAKLVDERLESKIAPLRHMLAESVVGGPKLSDIVGGIGWILGLFGVWALARRRI